MMMNDQKTTAASGLKQLRMPVESWLEQCGDQLQEVGERRSEAGKVYRLGENHFRAVVYGDSIHYRDKRSGAFRSINNRFVRTEGGLRNAANDNLSVFLGRGSVELTDPQDYRICWRIENGQDAMPQIVDAARGRKNVFEKLLGPDTVLQSEAVFESVLPGADWRCRIDGNAFKDEVVFHDAARVKPVTFHLQAPGLLLVQGEEGELVLEDAQHHPVFLLPEPWAMSADEAQEAGRVQVQIARSAPEDWLLTYTIDDGWLSRAAFPVRLDPAVVTYNARCAIDDAYTCSKQANTVHKGSSSNILRLTHNSGNWGKCDCYFKFDNTVLPELRASDYIVQATFTVATAQAGYPTSAFTATAHEVLSDWSPATLTYNNRPSHRNESLDYSSFAKNEGEGVVHGFNITNLVRKWYTGTNHGVMLTAESATYAQLRSSALGQTAEHRPLVIIDYISRAGLEDYLAYEDHSLGRAGTGHVSLFNGNLIFEHQDTSTGGTLLPVSVRHVYNSCCGPVNLFGLGYGWTTNCHQALRKETISGRLYYVWVDEDGTEVYFAQQDGAWKDQIGRGLTLTLGANAVITDKQGFQRVFAMPTAEFAGDWSRVCMLLRMEDAVGNAIVPSFSGRILNSMTDGAGRATTFSWDNGLLSGVAPAGNTDQLAYQYTNEMLQQITYADGLSSRYYYNSWRLLTDAYHPEGIHVHYEYTDDSPFRVTSVKITGKDGVTVSFWHTYAYQDMLTIVTDRLSGKQLRYHFNDVGNLVAVTDELGFGAFSQYSPSVQMNKPEIVSKMQYAIRNLLRNPLFEQDGVWVPGFNAGGTGSHAYVTSDRYIGTRSFLMTKTNDGGNVHIYQIVPGKEQTTYTFSVYARCEGETGLALGAATLNHDGSGIWLGGSEITLTNQWQRYTRTFTMPANLPASPTMTISLCAVNGAGKLWVDGAQLEEGVTAGCLNLLENADFTHGAERWTFNADRMAVLTNTDASKPKALSDNVLYMLGGGPGSGLRAYQDIPLRGAQGDVFVAGGWSSACSVPRNGHPERYRMAVQFYSDSAWVDGGSVEWSEEWSGWHMAAAPVAAPCAFSGVRVALDYQNNYNAAYFDGLFLYKEEFGHSFSYDGNGNLLSRKDLTAQKDAATYDAFNNMLTYRQPGRDESAKTTLTYGATEAEQSKRLPRTVTPPLGPVSSFQYDDKGNCTETVVTGSPLHIKTQTVYEADKNRVAARIDARGKRVSQEIDANRGTLKWVQDPKGQRVNYTYDAMKRLTRTETQVDNSVSYNEYAYDCDHLTQVRHNTSQSEADDVVYQFGYDAVGRPTTVRVGQQPLSTTSYNTDGTVSRVDYGNGGQVAYSYDDFKRVTGVKYDGSASPRYEYVYGSRGEIAQVKDNARGAVITSEYDLANRPMRKTTEYADYQRYVAEVGYDKYNNLEQFTEKVNDLQPFKTNFTYDIVNRPTKVDFGGHGQIVYTYDMLGRMQNQTVKVGGTNILSAYGYILGGHGEGSTSHLVEAIAQMGGYLSYVYDDCGNIIGVSDSTKQVTYAYDPLGQLTRVNDPYDTTLGSTGTTWVYAYDQGGNILSKKAYAYTQGAVGAAVRTDTYTYGDANWKDKLTAYNGQTITYDAIGNPLNDGDWTYTWQHGRQLKSMSKAGETVSFIYNEDGLRVRKTATSTGTTNYTLHGKNIVHLMNGKNSMHFFYDARNRPAVVTYNGVDYAYIYNVQGDVIALVDSTGAKVVEYYYDAWGKILSVTGTLATTLGTLNPFRYRGYVFDEETGLYYLRSRYYNPEKARFINADTVYSGNLFSYCRNAPVYQVDNNGQECKSCGQEHVQFSGTAGDPMSHVLKNDYRKGRMKVCHFMTLLGQMLDEEWQYSHDTAYGFVDCVGVYRYSMYWFYGKTSVKALRISSHVEGIYRNSVYNTTIKRKNVRGKGKITSETEFIIGMGLFRNPLGDDGHFAVYVGDWFEGYENAVIESVYGGVVIRELSESEAINGEFTHYGYMKGLDYTN